MADPMEPHLATQRGQRKATYLENQMEHSKDAYLDRRKEPDLVSRMVHWMVSQLEYRKEHLWASMSGMEMA